KGDQIRRPRILRMTKIGSNTPETPRRIVGSGPNALRRASQRANAQTAIATQLRKTESIAWRYIGVCGWLSDTRKMAEARTTSVEPIHDREDRVSEVPNRSCNFVNAGRTFRLHLYPKRVFPFRVSSRHFPL